MSEIIVGAIIIALALYLILEFHQQIKTIFYVAILSGLCWIVGFICLRIIE